MDKKEKIVKLHVGCGNIYLDGFINIDLDPAHKLKVDLRADIRDLPFKDNSVDVILAYHVIEHVHFHEALEMFKNWYRILKPGGWIVIECPDLVKTSKSFLDNTIPLSRVYINLYGQSWHPGQEHYYCWFPEQLKWALKGAGFKNFIEKPAIRYTDLYKWCMHLEAMK